MIANDRKIPTGRQYFLTKSSEATLSLFGLMMILGSEVPLLHRMHVKGAVASQIFYNKMMNMNWRVSCLKLSVAEIARRDLVICRTSDNLWIVANQMLDREVGSVLVKGTDDIVGIVTKNDLLRAYLSGRDWKETTADVVMSHPVATCSADDTIDEALHRFENTRYSRMAVRDKSGEIIGVAKRKILERFQVISANYDMVRRQMETSLWRRMDRRLRKSRSRAYEDSIK